MSSVKVGNRGEQAAAEYLAREGYEILQLNYRRPHCEIDIVAKRREVIYFVEVKYRSTDHFGSGLDYITPQKLHHMQRAAETWVMSHHYEGEYVLSAIEVGGPGFEVLNFIEEIY